MMDDFFDVAERLGYEPEWAEDDQGNEVREAINLTVHSWNLVIQQQGPIGLLTFTYTPDPEEVAQIENLPDEQQAQHGQLVQKELLDEGFVGEQGRIEQNGEPQPFLTVGRYVDVDPEDTGSIRRFAETVQSVINKGLRLMSLYGVAIEEAEDAVDAGQPMPERQPEVG